MLPEQWRFSGGTRVQRPKRVEQCDQCGEAIGTNYLSCSRCFHAIEDIWLADWAALLQSEQIQAGSPDETLLAQVVIQESEWHSWTIVDIAMTLQRCGTCGNELGSHYTDCGECGMAFGAALMSEYGISGNGHALHVGRVVLRYPDQHSANAVAAWRLTIPRLLMGWLPTTEQAQEAMAQIKAGKLAEVKANIERFDQQINARS